LIERLRGEVGRLTGSEPPAAAAVPELIAGRDELFADDLYHVDVSHLSSVVQMSLQLPAGDPVLPLARELCAYGRKLSPQFQNPGDPPFEDLYADVDVYLATLAGDGAEAGLAHFRGKIDEAAAEGNTYPAEVYVNLLLRLGRGTEAVAAARQYLREADERTLACPGLYELCQKAKDYAALADSARDRGDPVHFLAGLIAARV
jgi:hypothetical protein